MTETRVPFQNVVDALLAPGKDFPKRYLSYFSDIDPASLAALLEAWPRVKPARKLSLLDKLKSLADEDTLVSFDDLSRALLADPDAGVRARAIRLLDECDDPKLVPAYIKILSGDEDGAARAEAANALGQFVMLGELEEISEAVHHKAEDALLASINNEKDVNVRRRALESLGFSSRPEVPALIESAYQRQSPEWQTSAMVAMGRSSDDRWEEQVISRLVNGDVRVQLAAVQAAGELGLPSARPILLNMLTEEESDEIFAAAIWSLSQIGGEDARTYIEALIAETEDDDLLDFLEDALENLAFTEDLERFDLLSFDPESIEDEEE